MDRMGGYFLPATMISTPGGFGKWIGIREPWDLLISTRFLRLGT
ncbi:MAG: hypothetical protein VX715_01175 [Planctomycetota bacterium]|nr:hypothetical protein [Planctomycetota bacterium]